MQVLIWQGNADITQEIYLTFLKCIKIRTYATLYDEMSLKSQGHIYLVATIILRNSYTKLEKK